MCEASPALLTARDIVADPVGYALKQIIEGIGKLLAERVKTVGELYKIADRVCGRGGRNDARWGERMEPINSAFDGIQTRDGATWWS